MPPSKGNPYFTTSTTAQIFWSSIYDTLTFVNEDGDVIPQLATDWRQMSDNVWEVDLRDDIVFSDGTPFNADTVVGLTRIFKSDEAVGQGLLRELDFIAEARALDNDTVEFTTSAPHALLPRYLSYFYVSPPDYLAEVGFQGIADAPIGTGPFVVDSWTAARVMLHANQTSWRAPKVDRLEALSLPDPTARVQALVSDRIDIAFHLGTDSIRQLEMAGLTYVVRNPTRISVYGLVTEKEGSPFKDVRVRQAVNYGVNRKAITETLLSGLADPSSQTAPPAAFGYNPDLEPYPYDPEKARALLAEAGYPDGLDMIIEAVVAASTDSASVVQQVAADLARVGIRLEVRTVLLSQMVSLMQQGGWAGYMFSTDYASAPTLDALRPFRLHSCTWSTPWFCDPEADAIIAAAKAAPDEEERRRLTQKVLKMYRDRAQSLILFPMIGLDGIGRRVTHFDPMNDRPSYHTITLAD